MTRPPRQNISGSRQARKRWSDRRAVEGLDGERRRLHAGQAPQIDGHRLLSGGVCPAREGAHAAGPAEEVVRGASAELVVGEIALARQQAEALGRGEREQPPRARADRAVARVGLRGWGHGHFVAHGPAVAAPLIRPGLVHGGSFWRGAVVRYCRNTIVTPGNHGILNPRGGEGHFALARAAAPADLAAFVERTWSVRWDLRGRPPHDQETLPWPCAHLVIGTYRPGLFGVCRTRIVAHPEGEGWVVGVKFRPGGPAPFIGFSLAELTDRDVPIGE